jgi:hypothetical protein
MALVKRIPASSALGNENGEDAQQQSKIVLCGGDGASLLLRVLEPLVNNAHFQKSIS